MRTSTFYTDHVKKHTGHDVILTHRLFSCIQIKSVISVLCGSLGVSQLGLFGMPQCKTTHGVTEPGWGCFKLSRLSRMQSSSVGVFVRTLRGSSPNSSAQRAQKHPQKPSATTIKARLANTKQLFHSFSPFSGLENSDSINHKPLFTDKGQICTQQT